ncbi:MAG: hypothetical protein ACE5OW_00755 [Candidatus Bathyarchaeia archaeon]
MYDELYEAWREERESAEVQKLPRDFFVRLAGYVKKIREEGRMLDKKTTRARLIQREFKNVKKLVRDLIQLRYDKALRKAMTGKIVPRDVLTEEEERLQSDISPSVEAYQALLKKILTGRLPHLERKEKPKTVVVRILQEIPAIIGSDMKTYGPFKPEDIATLPAENARVLIKQGVAVEVEAKL